MADDLGVDVVDTSEMPSVETDEAFLALKAYNAEQRERIAKINDLVRERTK
jgi:hypothetical protein